MLIDWIHWLSSIPYEGLLWPLLPLLCTDLPRHAIASVLVVWLDTLCWGVDPRRRLPTASCQPSVCVVIAGLNESQNIARTLTTVWGSYPNLEILVVDDGSTDGMSTVVSRFAEDHAGVTSLRKRSRGGKSSALNYALACANSEVIVCVDADCELGPRAIWEIVQPFSDPGVGAVSGTVMVNNAFENLTTWLQAFEYLRCIFLGRRVSSLLGTLGIVSGAFGAYRREALDRTMGWDVGPGEDGDITLKIRKSGYRVVFAPQAECFTNVPSCWWALLRQRRRWNWATVTFGCRKHCDIGSPLAANFRLGNLAWLLERWFFGIFLTYFLWAYVIWLCFHYSETTGNLLVLYYLVYVLLDAIQTCAILYFSTNIRRDLMIATVIPLAPFYHLFLRAVSLWSTTEELLTRRSYRDGFVPEHVRRATWHW